MIKNTSKKRNVKKQTKRKVTSRAAKESMAKTPASKKKKKGPGRPRKKAIKKRKLRMPAAMSSEFGGERVRTTLSFPIGLLQQIEEEVIRRVREETGYLMTRAAVFNAGVKIVVENHEKMELRRVYNLVTFTDELRRVLKVKK